MRQLSLLSLVALTTGTLFACSAAPDAAEQDDTSSSELRTLSSGEIAATIEYCTKYLEVENPGDDGASGGRKIYRAVRFEAAAGDEIVASAIGANAADPVLYLLGDRFGTVAYNDDREPGAKDSEIVRKLTRSGTYYLAFRTKEGWRTKFYVSLAKKGAETPPPPPPATWRNGLSGFDLWGLGFKDALPSSSYYSSQRKSVVCKVVPSTATIACGTMLESTPVIASIADDGSFAVNTGSPGTTGGELAGRIAADGTATLTRFRRTECFQTSSKWCEGHETDGTHLPATAASYRLCRTKDQHFASGGWAAGFYVDCSRCDDYASIGGCEGR